MLLHHPRPLPALQPRGAERGGHDEVGGEHALSNTAGEGNIEQVL